MTMIREGIEKRIQKGARITLKNILYLTDFSEYSEAALPFALALARNYGACVHALHVLTPVIPQGCPEAVEADEKLAADEMKMVDTEKSITRGKDSSGKYVWMDVFVKRDGKWVAIRSQSAMVK